MFIGELLLILSVFVLYALFGLYMRNLVHMRNDPPRDTLLIKYLPISCLCCDKIIPGYHLRTLLGFRLYAGGSICQKCKSEN